VTYSSSWQGELKSNAPTLVSLNAWTLWRLARLDNTCSMCKSFPNVFPPSTTEAIIYITLFPFNEVGSRLNWHMYYVLDWSFVVIREISHHGWIIQKSPMKPDKLLFSVSSVWKFMGCQPKTCLAKKLDGFHVLVYNQVEWPFAKMHSCSRHEFLAVEL